MIGLISRMRRFFRDDENRHLQYSYQGIVRYMPLIVAGGFFLATVFLFAFGPLEWNPSDPVKLYAFLLSCFAALVIGYTLAVRKGRSPGKKLELNVNRYLLVVAAVAFAVYFPTVYAGTGKWYPDVYMGIFQTGKAYRIAKFYSADGPKWVFYLRMLLAPLLTAIMPITLFYRSKLSKAGFAAGVTMIVLNVSLSISQGVSKQVADVAMQLVLMLCIIMFAYDKKSGDKGGWKYKAKIVLIILSICILFFAYYSNAMRNRISADVAMGESGLTDISSEEELEKFKSTSDKLKVEDDELDQIVGNYSTFSVGAAKENSLWTKLIPKKLQSMVNYMTSYFCHGYHGLSLALEQDFTSSYGLGFSDFIRHNVLRFFGGAEAENAVYQRTYMAKISDQGWPTGAVWSSFFVFPASDITFPGTVLLVLVIGFLFGLSWKDAVEGENVFALVTFMSLCTMVVYFCANNQIFQTGEPCLGFVGNFLLWMITRRMQFRKNGEH